MSYRFSLLTNCVFSQKNFLKLFLISFGQYSFCSLFFIAYLSSCSCKMCLDKSKNKDKKNIKKNKKKRKMVGQYGDFGTFQYQYQWFLHVSHESLLKPLVEPSNTIQSCN